MPEALPATVPDAVHTVPLAAIDAEALTRDRTAQGAEALVELTASIARHGLRQPIEIFPLATPPPTARASA